MSKDLSNLKRAYALNTGDEAKALYRDWATEYDSDFADRLGYVSPQRIAEFYKAEADPAAHVLDVGAGTGLLAEHLRDHVVDALDFSPEMLAVAKEKTLYRALIEADLTQTLDIEDARYGGIVCSGTFTHGHVGAECLPELLRIAQPGALFCCSVHPDVFDAMRFGSALGILVAQGRIDPVRFRHFRLYSDAGHADDQAMGLAMLFRKLS